MNDKWIALKQTEGDRQTFYVRVDAISALGPSGQGSRLWIDGTPVTVEETPQQVIAKLKAPKALLGRKGEKEGE